MNIAQRNAKMKQDKELALSKLNETYPEVKTAFDAIDNLEVEQVFDFTKVRIPVPKDIKQVSELSTSSIPPRMLNNMYKGGVTAHGNALGKLFMIEYDNGDVKYAPARQVYMLRGKEVDKDKYKNGSGDKSISIVPDIKRLYTKDQFAKEMMTTQKGLSQFTEYENSKKGIESQYKEEKDDSQKGGIDGIDEMVWNKMDRGYNDGKLVKGIKWNNHDDHIHIGAINPKAMLEIIKKAKSLGLNATQNPFTGKVGKVHTNTSWHYKEFDGLYEGKKLGNGLDVSGDPNKMKELFEWVESGGKLSEDNTKVTEYRKKYKY
jgi:hypothetical protein